MRNRFLLLVGILLPLLNLSAQNFEWGHAFIDSWGSQMDKVVVKALPNGWSYLAGSFYGPINCNSGQNPTSLNSSNGINFFIQKLDPSGNLVWVKPIVGSGGSLGERTVSELEVDSLGNIYLVGTFSGIMDFDPSTSTANHSAISPGGAFILKMDSYGNLVWVRTIIGDGGVTGNSIALDASNNVYLTGNFQDTVDFDPGLNVEQFIAESGQSMFVLKLDSDGDFVWNKQFGNSTYDSSLDIETDNHNNVYIAGKFRGTTDFDPGLDTFNLFSPSDDAAFLSKLTTNGNLVWAFSLEDPNSTYVHNTLISKIQTSKEHIYLAGLFRGTVDFDPSPDTLFLSEGTGQRNVFVLKIDTSANFEWAIKNPVQVPVNCHWNYQTPYPTFVLDKEEAIYLTGTFTQGDFDPGIGTHTLVDSFGSDPFVQKLSPDGDLIWVKQLPGGTIGGGDDGAYDIALDSSGNIFLTGFCFDLIDVDPDSSVHLLNPPQEYQGVGGATPLPFLTKWSMDSCANMYIRVDSTSDVTCTVQGYASSEIFNGLPPFSYVWDNASPSSDSFSTFTGSGMHNLTVTDANFCQKHSTILIGGPLSQNHFDFGINYASTLFRSTSNAFIWLNAYNTSCLAHSGRVYFITGTAHTNYLGATPIPDDIRGDTLIWYFSNLSHDSTQLSIQLEFSIDTLIGPASMYGNAIFPAWIFPSDGDADSTNNSIDISIPFLNSYDPNDKKVYPPGTCEQHYVQQDEPLTYTVRFQNTGNSEAINIAVLDSLSQYLDINSLQIISKSHPNLVTEIFPNNVVRFNFPNIHLPDSASNESKSHGFIIFKISPHSSSPLLTRIENRVGIYFDFNDPVYTNTVFNTLIDTLPEIDISVSQNDSVLTANNPIATYQWVDCSSGFPVIGQTDQTFTIPDNSSYSVIVTEGDCFESSRCFSVLNTSTEHLDYIASHITAFPNPTNGHLSIDLGQQFQNINLHLVDALGQAVLSQKYSATQFLNIDFNAAKGVYFLLISLEGKPAQTFKILKY